MKQSIGKNGYGSLSSTMFTEDDENQVLEILVEMPRLVLEFEERRRFPFTWACKRRRSAIHVTPSPPLPLPLPPRRLSSSSSSPPSHHGGAVVGPSCETASLALVKAEASSPATPLSFSPTESDEKPHLLRRKASLKRKREYYLKIIEDLTKSKALLNQEIDTVKRYCDQLKAFNLKLKARKEELSQVPKSECKIPSLEIGSQMQLVHAPVNSSNSMAENQQQKQKQQQQQQQQQQLPMPSPPHYLPLMLNQTPGPSQICNSVSEGVAKFQYASGQPTTSLPMPMPMPIPIPSSSSSALIPDLNVSLEEFISVNSCQPLDVTFMANKNLSRAMAAQARQKRIQICRVKNPIGISKLRYSHR